MAHLLPNPSLTRRRFAAALVFAAALALPQAGFAQGDPLFATHFAADYRMVPNVTYLTAGGVDLKLDVYQRLGVEGPQPTMIYMHGGFWVAGTKEAALGNFLPWLEMGWNVVNVEYRLGPVALAPAAMEDCMCALRWVAQNADRYNFDLNKIVTYGQSAGGHLALALGVIPESEGFALECAGPPLPKVAAIINWAGVSDVPDVISGPNMEFAAARWFGSMPDRLDLAARLSPIHYLRADLPPIVSVHGDQDNVVPYAQSVRLHKELDRLGVPNRLITVPGAGHSSHGAAQREVIYKALREFFAEQGLLP